MKENKLLSLLPGILVCLALGLAATFLGGLQSVIGAPMIGLILGVILSNAAPRLIKTTGAGAAFCQKYLLKAGIILAGGTLSLRSVVGVGVGALPLIIFNICLAFGAALLLGKAFGVSSRTGALIGGGTAICGGTAIAALTPVVEADEEEMAYAMTAIFLFDVFAAIIWPYAAVAMGLSAEQYGILGGLAISDTASVTAAAGTFDMLSGARSASGVSGGDLAIIVKLTRTVMLIFVVLAVMLVTAVKNRGSERSVSMAKSLKKAFPLFVLGFLVMALLNTLLDFSSISLGTLKLSKLLSKGYKYLIAVALVGVGYKIRLADVFKKGLKPVLLGGCTWALVAVSTLIYVLKIM